MLQPASLPLRWARKLVLEQSDQWNLREPPPHPASRVRPSGSNHRRKTEIVLIRSHRPWNRLMGVSFGSKPIYPSGPSRDPFKVSTRIGVPLHDPQVQKRDLGHPRVSTLYLFPLFWSLQQPCCSRSSLFSRRGLKVRTGARPEPLRRWISRIFSLERPLLGPQQDQRINRQRALRWNPGSQ